MLSAPLWAPGKTGTNLLDLVLDFLILPNWQCSDGNKSRKDEVHKYVLEIDLFCVDTMENILDSPSVILHIVSSFSAKFALKSPLYLMGTGSIK